MVKRTKTRTATIYMDENGILNVQMHEGIHLDYEDALDNFLVMRTLSGNKPALKLIDARNKWTMDKKAGEFIRSKDAKENTIARAVVKSSLFSKVLSSFFSRLHAPDVPVKIFTNYDEAYAWLMELKKGLQKPS